MKIFRKNATAVVLVVLFAALAASAAPAARSGEANETNVIRSVFVLPSNPKEGRDPFFPDSNRPYETAAANHRPADVSLLVVRGFSGPLADRLVIINNHTFGVGDEADVTTSAGRLHLRCLEITHDSVLIEVGGQRHRLFYTNLP